jgi:hypothetical protein
MKPILKFIACILLIGIVIVFSCKKDAISKDNHRPPVAKAGQDVTVTLSSCAAGFAILDGSNSSDPDNNITSYLWTKISGAPSATLSNYTSATAKAENLFVGQYAFELKVTDAGGLSSKDTILVNVTGSRGLQNLDVTGDGTFAFSDNYEDCYYGPPCSYYDFTTAQGWFTFAPIGQFSFSIYESTDTAYAANDHNTNMSIYTGTGNGPQAWGRCSVNFKDVIQNGGGPFNGTFIPQGGSATQICGQAIYTTLDPLAFAGNLDMTTHRITISIKGKIYF